MFRTSHSQRERFASCEHKWKLQNVDRIERANKGLARFMGEAFSEALNVTNKRGMDAVGEFLEDFYSDLIQRFPDSERELLNQLVVVDTYSELYAELYPDLTAANMEREVEFNVNLAAGVVNNGYFDGLSPEYVVEDKLLSSLSWGKWSADHLLVDEQVTGYLHAAREVSGVDLLMYRVFIKPGIRLKATETEDEFRIRLRETILNDQQKYVLEFPCRRTDAELDAWAAKALDVVETQQSIKDSNLDGEKNFHACIGKYGGCEFFEKCHGLDTTGLFVKREERGA